MKHRTLDTLTFTTIVAMTYLTGCGRAEPKPTYQQMTIDEAIHKVHFKVKQPTLFPFRVTNTTAFIETVDSAIGQKVEVILIYQNKEQQKTLLETVTDGIVKAPADGNETNLKLANGQDAVYVTFPQLSALMWWDNGESYTIQDKQGPLTSNHTTPFLSPNQLVEIANSVK
jgi:hypothetical protein